MLRIEHVMFGRKSSKGISGHGARDSAWRGCNVTIPHKQDVQPYLDQMDEKAEAIGAVNTVFRSAHRTLSATNTDVDGVREAIEQTPADKGIAVVLGAGGAARAAFAQLARMDLSEIRVIARTPAKAGQAVRQCGLDARIFPICRWRQRIRRCEFADQRNPARHDWSGRDAGIRDRGPVCDE